MSEIIQYRFRVTKSDDVEVTSEGDIAIEDQELEKIEATIDRAAELVQLFTEASLLTAGFHTHRRQWRRKRNVVRC